MIDGGCDGTVSRLSDTISWAAPPRSFTVDGVTSPQEVPLGSAKPRVTVPLKPAAWVTPSLVSAVTVSGND